MAWRLRASSESRMPDRRSCFSCGASSVMGFMLRNSLGGKDAWGVGSVKRAAVVGEQTGGGAGKAGTPGVGLGRDRGSGGEVVAAGQDRLDGAVVRAVVGERTTASGLQAGRVVLGLQMEHALRGAQPLGNAIRQEPADEPGAGLAHLACLRQ